MVDASDRIIAHVDLLRAVDRMLAEAEAVRTKRATLDRILSDLSRKDGVDVATQKAGVPHA
jgi:hypothetical protein